MRTVSKRIAVLLILALLALASSPAHACDCISPKNATVASDHANAVFVGTAISAEETLVPCDNGECEHVYSSVKLDNGELMGRRVHVTFSVKAGWKGVNQPQFTVTLADESCSYWFDIGREYLVFADALDGVGLVVGMCSRTYPVLADKKFSQAHRDIAELGAANYIPKEVGKPHN